MSTSLYGLGYELQRAPFRIGPFTGWGTFAVQIRIVDVNGKTKEVQFPLSFSASDSFIPVELA